MTTLILVVSGVIGARLFGRSTRPSWAVWAAAAGAYCAVLALRAGWFVGRAAWLAYAVAYALELHRIVRAWRRIPARDSVTR